MTPETCFTPLNLIQFYFSAEGLHPTCYLLLNMAVKSTQMHITRYLYIFSLTCLLEAPIYFYFFKDQAWKIRLRRLLIFYCASHHLMTFMFPLALSRFVFSNGQYLMASEVSAILIEFVILKQFFNLTVKRAALAAVSANLFSWWAGLYFI